jgi:hypothetical protein
VALLETTDAMVVHLVFEIISVEVDEVGVLVLMLDMPELVDEVLECTTHLRVLLFLAEILKFLQQLQLLEPDTMVVQVSIIEAAM